MATKWSPKSPAGGRSCVARGDGAAGVPSAGCANPADLERHAAAESRPGDPPANGLRPRATRRRSLWRRVGGLPFPRGLPGRQRRNWLNIVLCYRKFFFLQLLTQKLLHSNRCCNTLFSINNNNLAGSVAQLLSCPSSSRLYSGQNSASMIRSNDQGQAAGKVASDKAVSDAASMRAIS